MADLTVGEPLWNKRYLFELEPAKIIYKLTWTSAGPAFYTTLTERNFSKVEEWLISANPFKDENPLTIYEEVGSIALCQATTASWYWSSGNSRLYVHTSDGDAPDTLAYGKPKYLMLAYFAEYHADSPIVLDGHDYRPDIDSSTIPSIEMSTGGFHEGGVTHSFGSIKFLNADGYWDTRFENYIYEAKKIVLKVGDLSATDSSSYKTYWNGWIGNITWSDLNVEMNIEDLRVCVK